MGMKYFSSASSNFVFFLFTFLLSLNLWGAKLNSFCYMNLTTNSKIQGLNTNTKIPIASVSKLLTSHWLIKAKGLDYRFTTEIYAKEIEGGEFDLHFSGTRDPYFGAEKLHYVISELNKRGLKKIRNLSFDEKFKFLWFVDDPEALGNSTIAKSHYINSNPSPQTVLANLKKYNSFLFGYEETQKKAAKLKIDMILKPQFTVKNIEYLPSTEFTPETSDTVYYVHSAKSSDLLKEMNRNSNNHSANQIFEHLGSSSAYQDFLETELNLTSSDVVMLNGSGDRVDTEKGARYNEASCAAVLHIIRDLNESLIRQKTNLSKIATVVGTNSGTANMYNHGLTVDAVVAKTGTVNPSITLGGFASTNNGIILFMYMVSPQGSNPAARQIIRNDLIRLFKNNGGPKPINGQSFSYFTVDQESFSEAQSIGTLN